MSVLVMGAGYFGDTEAVLVGPKRKKLELGAGYRGTRGYTHQDAYPFDGIDITCKPWELPYGDGELDEVLALAFIEHLTYGEAFDTFREVHRVLRPGGELVFDVPDYPVWAQMYCHLLAGGMAEATLEHCRQTLFGWQRWPGDEHKSGWDLNYLDKALVEAGFFQVSCSPSGEGFLERGLYRRRFAQPWNAHLYVVATK